MPLFRILLFIVLAGPAFAEPIRFTHVIRFEDRRMAVPLEVWPSVESAHRMGVKVAGNLRVVQRNLPAILSTVVEDSCTRRIGLEIDETHAEGDSIRARGRVQITVYRCRDESNPETRRLRLSNIAEIDLLLDGRLANDCVEIYLRDLAIAPSGLAGGIMSLTGLNNRVSERVRGRLNTVLNEEENCLDLPDALKLVNTRLVSGGLRDFGGGEMGFVLKGTVDVTAEKMVALLSYLNAQGRLRTRPLSE